jgi:hypothetical protein
VSGSSGATEARPAYPPTERHRHADQLAMWLHKAGLARQRVATRHPEGRNYFVHWGKDAVQGTVYVWGPQYVTVSVSPPAALAGTRLYGGIWEAALFVLACCENDTAAALAINQKVVKNPRRRY